MNGLNRAVYHVPVDKYLRLEHPRGTYGYMAPEVTGDFQFPGTSHMALGRPSDIWSLGAIVLELAFARPPPKSFVKHLASSRYSNAIQRDYTREEWADIKRPDEIPAEDRSFVEHFRKLPQHLRRFIVDCLRENLLERLSAAELLQIHQSWTPNAAPYPFDIGLYDAILQFSAAFTVLMDRVNPARGMSMRTWNPTVLHKPVTYRYFIAPANGNATTQPQQWPQQPPQPQQHQQHQPIPAQMPQFFGGGPAMFGAPAPHAPAAPQAPGDPFAAPRS